MPRLMSTLNVIDTSTNDPEPCFKKKMLTHGRHNRDRTALTLCAEGGRVDLCRLLIDSKADVNEKARLYP
jgi:hypothetical protein